MSGCVATRGEVRLTGLPPTLIVPALATYRHAAGRQLGLGYVVALLSYVIGLGVSVVTDLPSSAVIVWSMAVVAVVVHLTARPGTR